MLQEELINYILNHASDNVSTTEEEEDDEVTTDDDNDLLATLPRHLMTAAGTSMISVADTEAESTTPLTGLEDANLSHHVDDASSPSSSANGERSAPAVQSGTGKDIAPNKEPEKEDTSTARALTAEMEDATNEQHSVPHSSMDSTTPLLDNMVGANATDAKPATSSTDGNSIGLAYDVPIESEDSVDEAAAATMTSASKTDLPPWANDGKPEEKSEEKEESSNAGAIAAGVAAGTVAVGTIAADVLASENDEDAPAASSNNDQVTDEAAAVPKEQGVDSRTSPVRAGTHVAEMVSLFEKEDNDTVPISYGSPVETAVKKSESEDRNEVHLLDGFTTEEDDDDLFKPEIPQNLKTKGGRGFRHGDSEFDGIEEHESVKTQEFPDDDTTTAASFDNVLVVDLHDTASETKGTEDKSTPDNTSTVKERELVGPTAGEVAVADAENDKVPVKKYAEPTPPSTTRNAADEAAGDVPAKTNATKRTKLLCPLLTKKMTLSQRVHQLFLSRQILVLKLVPERLKVLTPGEQMTLKTTRPIAFFLPKNTHLKRRRVKENQVIAQSPSPVSSETALHWTGKTTATLKESHCY